MGEVRVVDDVSGAFADLVHARPPRSIALSGGATAEQCYRAIAARAPDWSAVDAFFGDERCVPVGDPDSNEGMARRVLLDAARPRAVHSLAEAGPTPASAADAYDALVRMGDPIDLVHLGLGPDGHTASLFPGAPSLDVLDRMVVATGDALHPHPRLTFTYAAIARAHLVVVTVAGEEKREVFSRVRAGDNVLPATRVRAHEVIWLTDRAALG